MRKAVLIAFAVLLTSIQVYADKIEDSPLTFSLGRTYENAHTNNYADGTPAYTRYWYIIINYNGTSVFREGPYSEAFPLDAMNVRYAKYLNVLGKAITDKKNVIVDTIPFPWQSPIREAK